MTWHPDELERLERDAEHDERELEREERLDAGDDDVVRHVDALHRSGVSSASIQTYRTRRGRRAGYYGDDPEGEHERRLEARAERAGRLDEDRLEWGDSGRL